MSMPPDQTKKAEDILHPAIRKLAQLQADTYFKSGKEIVILMRV